MYKKKRLKVCSEALLRKVLIGWFGAVFMEYIMLPVRYKRLDDLEGIRSMNISRLFFLVIIIAVFLFVVHTIMSLKKDQEKIVQYEKIEKGILLCFFMLQGGVSLIFNYSLSFLVLYILVCIVLIRYANIEWRKINSKMILFFLCTLFFLFVSVWGICRIYSFSTPTYDFGLFAQMFHYMKSTGLPFTTLERAELMSHMQVHVSPIFYLMLPGYMLVPSPVTLQIEQALVMTLAVIPLWKLAKGHHLTDKQALVLCVMLLIMPAFSGGASYDLHENCFLSVCILSLLYFVENKNIKGILISALLTLAIKEDASMYVAVIGLWVLVKNYRDKDYRSLRIGVCLIAASVLWFLAATSYLSCFGDGVMSGRFNNFIYNENGSLFSMFITIFANPMKVFYEITETEKLQYIGLTILPILPFVILSKRYENYILLIPYVLLNLMSDYHYQHEIFFQYNFGSIALLTYLYLLTISEYGKGWKMVAGLVIPVTIYAVLFSCYNIPKAISYPVRAIENYEHYEEIRSFLAEIPKDSSVATTTFYTTYFSDRDVIWDIKYAEQEKIFDSEYIIIPRDEKSTYKKYTSKAVDARDFDGYERFCELLINNGYRLIAAYDGSLYIYRLAD